MPRVSAAGHPFEEPFWFLGVQARLDRRFEDEEGRPRFSSWVTAVVLGAVPFGVALVVSVFWGHGGLFVSTPAVYLGWFGVSWVVWASCLGVRHLAQALDQVSSVVASRDEYVRLVERTFTRAADIRTTRWWILGAGLACAALIVSALSAWSGDGQTGSSRVVDWFPVGWHDSLAWSAVVLAIFGASLAVAFGTSFELLLRNLRFVWELRSTEHAHFIAFPALVRLHLQPLLRVYVRVSISWSIGVALFVLFFLGSYSARTVAGIALLFALGVATLVVPWATCRRVLDRSHDEMSAQIAAGVMNGRTPRLYGLHADRFAAVSKSILEDPPPVLARRSSLAWAGVQLATVSVLVARSLVENAVT